MAMGGLPPRAALGVQAAARDEPRRQFAPLAEPEEPDPMRLNVPRCVIVLMVVFFPLVLVALVLLLLVVAVQAAVFGCWTASRHPCCWQWRWCYHRRPQGWDTLNAAADVGSARAVREMVTSRCVTLSDATSVRLAMLLQKPPPDQSAYPTYGQWQAARASVVMAVLEHPDLTPPGSGALLPLVAIADVGDVRVWERMVQLGASTTAAQPDVVRSHRGGGGGGGGGEGGAAPDWVKAARMFATTRVPSR